MFEYRLLIPEERVGVLIGEDGGIKRLIEETTGTSLEVNQEEVTIRSEDSFNAWNCQQVVKAIGRGFNPKNALLLVKKGYSLEVINVMSYARNQKDKFRLRGRVIGEKGKTRRFIERLTNCRIVVFGKTISIIGSNPGLRDAREAITMLLKGAQTSTAYKFLENMSKNRLKKELL